MTLGRLTNTTASRLAARLMGAERLGPDVARLILSRGAGVPFFCEELASALERSGALRITDGVASLARDTTGARLDLPFIIRGAVTSRLDRLTAQEQLTIQIASVIGRRFSRALLAHVHTLLDDTAELAEQLERLAAADLCMLERPAPEWGYAFKHELVRESCYALLVLSRRRQLHRAVAEWLEARDASATPHVRLAYHWRRAGEPAQAMAHLEHIGFSALRAGADREAITSLRDAMAMFEAMDQASRDAMGPTREAELHRGVGTALHGVGQLDRCESSLRQALTILGWPLPEVPARWVLRLLLEGARQLLLRALPGAPLRRPDHSHREAMLAASRASAWYSNVSYFRAEPLPWLVAGLISANLAELAGDRASAGTAYVNLSNIAGSLHLRWIERRYARIARESAEPRVALILDWSTAVVAMFHCEWALARASVDRGIARGRVSGDYWALGNGLVIKALIQYLTEPVSTRLALFEETVSMTRERENSEQEG